MSGVSAIRTLPTICVQRCNVSQVSLHAASGKSGHIGFSLTRQARLPMRNFWRSNSRGRDESAYLRLVLNPPEKAQQIVDAISAQVPLRHQTELLFHFSIGHWILEVPAVIFDADGLACA